MDTQEKSPPPLIEVRDESTSLLLIYRDSQGREQRAMSVSEVPDTAREHVRVVNLAFSPDQRKSREFIQVFDLRKTNADGTYPGRVIPRGELEASLIKASQPKPGLSTNQVQNQAHNQQPKITLYSTSWCGYCKKARAFLKKQKLKFTEHDIEKNRKAARKLAQKAKRAGLELGGVPVIDVGGRLMNGFDPKRLLSMIRQAQQ